MSRLRRATQLLSLVLVVLLPAMAQGQQSSLPGTWTLNREQSDDINEKINLAAARMNLVVRQIARPRLRSTNAAYPRMVITFDERYVRVDLQGAPSVSSPRDGEPVLWQRDTGGTCTTMRGNCVRVSTEWRDGLLRQAFVAEDGQRVNLFTLSPDGSTLTLHVTVTSPRLPDPLSYRLVYDRGI